MASDLFNGVLAATDEVQQTSALDAFLGEYRTDQLLINWQALDISRGRQFISIDQLKRFIDRQILEIDQAISRQVNAIIHHTDFMRLEAAWLGLRHLVQQVAQYEATKVKVINASWREICKDQINAIEFDQSRLFKKIYSEEFGTPGGEPYGVLIADYAVRHRPGDDHPYDDVAALRGLAQVAAAAFAPIVLGVDPALMGLDDFGDLERGVDLDAVFRQPEYTAWNALRKMPDARFVGLTLPQILVRRAYPDVSSRFDGFRFHEQRDQYVWGNAVYAFGAVVARSFGQFGWLADIQGVPVTEDSGGVVNELPVQWFSTDEPGVTARDSTDTRITDDLEKQLSEFGLMALTQIKHSRLSAFYRCPSLHTPEKYDKASANLNARLSANLQYIFCASRFAQYLKVLVRDKIGSLMTPEECQEYLYRWLYQYTNARDDVPDAARTKYPLREVKVQVSEAPGRPGVYNCVVHLRPHYRLESIVSSLKLVTEFDSFTTE